LDLTKTRLQIQGEVAAASHSGTNVSIRQKADVTVNKCCWS